jgi:hypothetical protein
VELERPVEPAVPVKQVVLEQLVVQVVPEQQAERVGLEQPVEPVAQVKQAVQVGPERQAEQVEQVGPEQLVARVAPEQPAVQEQQDPLEHLRGKTAQK